MKASSDPQPRSPSIRRSLVLSFAQQYTNLLFSVPTVMILSRLLTPAQIGVYSVAVAVTTVVQMLRDFGVSEYLVQEKDLNDEVARSAFTVNLLMAWTLALIVFASSPWVADFYQEPGLSLVLKVLSINFVLLPFGSVVSALLNRSLQFGILYKINLGQVLIKTGTTITLAALGYGYMSLAWGAVSGMSANVLGCLFWGRAYRIRGLGLSHWRAVTRFGLKQTVNDIVRQLGFYAPDFVIGRTLGFTDVGLYSRGYGLLNLFQTKIIGAIGSVSFPAFARSHRGQNDAPELYLKVLTYITGISLPFMAFAAFMAFPIIRIMFGSQWDDAVPILRLLAVAAFVSSMAPQFGEFLVATGRVGILSIATTLIQVLSVGLLIPASFYSLDAAAASQIVVAVFGIALEYWLLRKYGKVGFHDLLNALWPSLQLTAAAALVPALVYVFLPVSSDADRWLSLVVAGIGGGGGWLLSVWLTKHPLWSEMVNASNRFLQRRKSARA